ncbi:hypothetical protein AMTRI_Chr02g218840 [Amborella trichopoda]
MLLAYILLLFPLFLVRQVVGGIPRIHCIYWIFGGCYNSPVSSCYICFKGIFRICSQGR